MLSEIEQYLDRRYTCALSGKLETGQLETGQTATIDDSLDDEILVETSRPILPDYSRIHAFTVESILYIFSLNSPTDEIQQMKDEFLKEVMIWLETGDAGNLLFYEWLLLQIYLKLTSKTFPTTRAQGATSTEQILTRNLPTIDMESPLKMTQNIIFGESGSYNPRNCQLVYGDKIATFNFFIDGPVFLLLLESYNNWVSLQELYELTIQNKKPTPKRINELVSGIRLKFRRARIPLFIHNIPGEAYMLSHHSSLEGIKVKS